VREIGTGISKPKPLPPPEAVDGGLIIAAPSEPPRVLVKGLRWRRLPAQVPWKIPALFAVGLLAVTTIKFYLLMK
jgi:hypothetical protein